MKYQPDNNKQQPSSKGPTEAGATMMKGADAASIHSWDEDGKVSYADATAGNLKLPNDQIPSFNGCPYIGWAWSLGQRKPLRVSSETQSMCVYWYAPSSQIRHDTVIIV